MTQFTCSQCAKKYSPRTESAGRTTMLCSSCERQLAMPATQETVAPTVRKQIKFSCTKCSMKFSVLAEFAGRKTICPTCKEPLLVPLAERTVAYVPSAGGLDGARSSVAQAGLDAA